MRGREEQVGGLLSLRSRIMRALGACSVSAIAFLPPARRLADGAYIPRAHERRVSLEALERIDWHQQKRVWYNKLICHSPFPPVQGCA
jgi:hypothetical protein